MSEWTVVERPIQTLNLKPYRGLIIQPSDKVRDPMRNIGGAGSCQSASLPGFCPEDSDLGEGLGEGV